MPILMTLKISPNPRPDLIDHWQGYLAESIIRKRKYPSSWGDYSDDALEKRWQNYLKKEAHFRGPPQEEVIQCWESALRKSREEDKDNGNTDSNASDSEDGSD
jgi:hypothetical protein